MQISNDEYLHFKPLLFSLGYRMLGSITETEDAMHETFLKAYQIPEEKLENKKAYLCKMMTNRCLDVLKSARYRREHYMGPWNPEPLLLENEFEGDPSQALLQKEGLSIAYLRMMEHLNPDERAVLLLRDVFDFSYTEIADIIEKSQDNCRKVFSRAKHKISGVENESLHYEHNQSLINHFIQAFETQNTEILLDLISDQVTLYSDGGGKVKSAVRPIESASNVLAFLYGIAKKVPEATFSDMTTINGQPAILYYMNGALYGTLSFYITKGQIEELYITLNPDKLPRS
ncbi:RNA polymerase sigma-70 factor [Thalassobacillus sp. CUG 92003]|uniref:RNA polymerase sigma-70 factor n=1 Tax=Thalassobacillus sp. CUG 92003 TaxID=2736641 RepID=UPI0015E678A6|nr:RNA polymerase sigma-70 factor [Thalassobacillus sp. CUG 92003]